LARAAPERGAYAEAARILDARRESLSRSAPVLSGDAMCKTLVTELHELSLRVADEREYKQTGRACALLPRRHELSLAAARLVGAALSLHDRGDGGFCSCVRDSGSGNAEDGEAIGKVT
jgi:hypothetical protein